MTKLPLFPLNTVLFPGGRCELRVFEKRYMDMVTTCLKREQPFGICLIRTGHEVGEAAQPHPFGTAAHIVECDVVEPGILSIAVRGGQRFRVAHTYVQPDKLIMADVEYLPEEGRTPLSIPYQRLSAILEKIITEVGEQHYSPPVKLDDAVWVAYRLAESLPVSNGLRQELLEESDPTYRLEMLAVAIDDAQTGRA